MQNYIVVTPRFSDFNGQGLLKASVHLDLACEAQLAQMTTRYQLPLDSFSKKGQRWHIAAFQIQYPQVIRVPEAIKIEADVVALGDAHMLVDFSFINSSKNIIHAHGQIKFELVDQMDAPVSLSEDMRAAFLKFGRR